MQTAAVIFFALLLASYSGPVSSQAPGQTTSSKPNKTAPQSNADRSAAEPGATSLSKLALPFKRAWQRLTEDAITLAPTLDSARIYLPLAGGRVFCLDRETGALLWSSEPGGIISAPAVANESAVYIVTRRIAEDGAESGGSLRAMDKATG